jgi:hypothetical protein
MHSSLNLGCGHCALTIIGGHLGINQNKKYLRYTKIRGKVAKACKFHQLNIP